MVRIRVESAFLVQEVYEAARELELEVLDTGVGVEIVFVWKLTLSWPRLSFFFAVQYVWRGPSVCLVCGAVFGPGSTRGGAIGMACPLKSSLLSRGGFGVG